MRTMVNQLKNDLRNIVKAFQILLKASTKYFILYWGVSILSALFPFIPLVLWKEIINTLTNPSSNGKIEKIYTFILIVVLYCGLYLLQRLINTVVSMISYKYNDEIDYYIDNMLISMTMNIDLAFFDSSELQNRLKNVTDIVGNATKDIATNVFETVQILIWLITSIIIISKLNVLYSLIIIILAIPAVIWSVKSQKMTYEYLQNRAENQRKMGYYRGLFSGDTLFEMKLYGTKKYFSDLYTGVWKELRHSMLQFGMKRAVLDGLSILLTTIGDVFIYIATIFQMLHRTIGVGDVTYYVSILSQFRFNLIGFFSCFRLVFGLAEEFAKLEIFNENVPVIEKGGSKIPGEISEIEFRNVSFQYPNSKHYVLRNCSFIITKGETCGLVGLNGSGKSTIVKLLLRFYDPQEGVILINGVDCRQYDLVKLRALFSVLFQDYVCYSFTLRENVAISNIDHVDDDQKIIEACDFAKVNKFINGWENGIDENLTRNFDPDGKELSGGQWQRISLARAFFRDAPIVLLDEPSATLDPIAEYEIFERFSDLSKDKCALLISHRLSSLVLADKILVLENGRIVEFGSHSALLNKNGRYAQLFYLQASKYQ